MSTISIGSAVDARINTISPIGGSWRFQTTISPTANPAKPRQATGALVAETGGSIGPGLPSTATGSFTFGNAGLRSGTWLQPLRGASQRRRTKKESIGGINNMQTNNVHRCVNKHGSA